MAVIAEKKLRKFRSRSIRSSGLDPFPNVDKSGRGHCKTRSLYHRSSEYITMCRFSVGSNVHVGWVAYRKCFNEQVKKLQSDKIMTVTDHDLFFGGYPKID